LSVIAYLEPDFLPVPRLADYAATAQRLPLCPATTSEANMIDEQSRRPSTPDGRLRADSLTIKRSSQPMTIRIMGIPCDQHR